MIQPDHATNPNGFTLENDGCNNLSIEGLEVHPGQYLTSGTWVDGQAACIFDWGWSTGTTVSDCKITGTVPSTPMINNGVQGIVTQELCTDVLIENCLFTDLDILGAGPGNKYIRCYISIDNENVTFQHNEITRIGEVSPWTSQNNIASLVTFEIGTNLTVRNNLIHDIRAEHPGDSGNMDYRCVWFGSWMTASPPIHTENVVFENNTLVSLDASGGGSSLFKQFRGVDYAESINVTSRNNILALASSPTGGSLNWTRGFSASATWPVTSYYTAVDVSWDDRYWTGVIAAIEDFATGVLANPLFVDVAGQDYHLQPTSPCKDTGDPDPAMNEPWDIGLRSDMGCYGGPAGDLPIGLKPRP